MRNSLVVAIVLQAVLLGSEAHGQVSNTGGLLLGLGLNGSSLELEDSELGGERETGGGLSAIIGYNFTPNIGIFIRGVGAEVQFDDGDDYTLGHGDLGARYTFLDAASAFRPFAEIAFTGLSAETEIEGGDLELSGTGFTGTIGLNYFFSPKFALDISAQYTSGEFNDLTIDGDGVTIDDGVDVSTGRFNFGAAWYPMNR